MTQPTVPSGSCTLYQPLLFARTTTEAPCWTVVTTLAVLYGPYRTFSDAVLTTAVGPVATDFTVVDCGAVGLTGDFVVVPVPITDPIDAPVHGRLAPRYLPIQ